MDKVMLMFVDEKCHSGISENNCSHTCHFSTGDTMILSSLEMLNFWDELTPEMQEHITYKNTKTQNQKE